MQKIKIYQYQLNGDLYTKQGTKQIHLSETQAMLISVLDTVKL